jgi:hypothetical protein
MRTTSLATGVSLCALAAAGLLAWSARATAASPKPLLDVSFGPAQVEADGQGVFYLVLRAVGGADSVFAGGDLVEARYGTKGGAGDLLAQGGRLALEGQAPAGVLVQEITSGPDQVGVRLAMQAGFTIPVGGAQVFLFDGPTASVGAAAVNVTTKVGKTAGKAPKAFTQIVAKTASSTVADFYGDGTDGPLDVAADAELQPLRSYTDVLIRAGVTVSVPSGTTIRCTGTFENRGTIVVEPGSPGGGVVQAAADPADEVSLPYAQAERGDSLSCPSTPGVGVFALPLSHYRVGGGGGTGARGAVGGAGGGLLRVIARGAVLNTGKIDARGAQSLVNRTGFVGGDGGGAGGGGGGIVLLLSGTSVVNKNPSDVGNPATGGIVDVSGGVGGTADPRGGAGGGGGGGLIVFCAPAVPENGTTLTLLGLGGFPNLAGDAATAETVWAGGGGGGACVGDGGAGGRVRPGGFVGPAPSTNETPSTAGQLVVRTADPRTLWR